MRPADADLAQKLESELISYSRTKRRLLGIENRTERQVLVEQILESIHRVKYVSVLLRRSHSPRRMDPNDELFDPLKSSILHLRAGNFDEAVWLVFLFIHFGKHLRGGWRYAREIYGSLGDGSPWNWVNVSQHPSDFQAWLNANQSHLKREGVPGGFGNHRKYESLVAYSPNGTGAAVVSYIDWVGPTRSHRDLFERSLRDSGGDPRAAFDLLYKSMRAVNRFGRTARFDYLTMIGKLRIAAIEPGSPYLRSATGPVIGAKLLFSGTKTASLNVDELDQWLVELDEKLNVGMQVIEDSLCNWQKSPSAFKAFRG